MSYTVLRVTDAGVVLFAQHERRLASAGEDALHAYRDFARTATPGNYSLRWQDGALAVTPRPASRYADRMPVRFVVSPFCGDSRPASKEPPPNRYEAVRVAGVATLLTSANESEIFETCTAAIVAWDGARLVVPPTDRPRVLSTSELELRARFDVIEAPIMRQSSWPLAATNAVVGLCLLTVDGRDPFPPDIGESIRGVFAASARRE